MKKINIHRSSKNKKLFGVCGGLAESFNIDATLIRVIWGILSAFYGAGIVIYFVCALIFPKN